VTPDVMWWRVMTWLCGAGFALTALFVAAPGLDLWAAGAFFTDGRGFEAGQTALARGLREVYRLAFVAACVAAAAGLTVRLLDPVAHARPGGALAVSDAVVRAGAGAAGQRRAQGGVGPRPPGADHRVRRRGAVLAAFRNRVGMRRQLLVRLGRRLGGGGAGCGVDRVVLAAFEPDRAPRPRVGRRRYGWRAEPISAWRRGGISSATLCWPS
jgi:hypothetical protein